MVREDTGTIVKVLPVHGWRPMKQLAARVHFFRCGGLLTTCLSRSSHDLSVEVFSRLVCRGRPEPVLRVSDIFRIHWSQHLLTTQSERPN
ncbi:UNVERIFIED_CONTAM: hypothetical protein NCL1_44075 [Trichonephila clavipes]